MKHDSVTVTDRTIYGSRLGRLLIWHCFVIYSLTSMVVNCEAGAFRLRCNGEGTGGLSGQVVTAEVASVSMRGPMLRTRSGVLNLKWENLQIEDADKAGRESGYFRITDSRHSITGKKEIEFDIFLVSKRDEKGQTNHVVLTRSVEHMHYGSEYWRGKDPTSSSWRSYQSQDSAHVPEFLDDTTVGIPGERIVLFRVTDHSGQLQPFEIKTCIQRATHHNEKDTIKRMLSLPECQAVVFDYDIARAYPEIPIWSLRAPDGWEVRWYGKSIQFKKEESKSLGPKWKWVLESDDDGPDTQMVPGKVTITRSNYVRERESPNKSIQATP